VNLDRPIVAAAAQIAPVFMKKKESIEKYAEAIHEAGKRRVDLLVTPEELERVAEKHSLPPEKLEAIARDLEGLAVEVDP